MKEYKVLIIGGGPAGASLGYMLKKNGISCCIIDKQKFPRKKLCGGLITKKTTELFEQIYNSKVAEYKLKTNTIGMYYKYDKISLIHTKYDFYLVDRYDFDYDLIKKYTSIGGAIYENTIIKEINSDNSIVELVNGQKIKYSYLVGADGANSTIRKLIDKTYKPDGLCMEINEPILSENKELQMHFGILNYGYGWVFPKGDVTTIGYGGVYEKNKDMVKLFNNYTQNIGIKCNEKVKGSFISFGKYVKTPTKDNIYLIGDAAGLVDPVTGEGLYYALLSSYTLSKIFILELDKDSTNSKYLNAIKSIHNEIDNMKKMRNIFFNSYFLKIAFNILKKHPNVVVYVCDNCISQYNVPLNKLITSYLKDKKIRKRK